MYSTNIVTRAIAIRNGSTSFSPQSNLKILVILEQVVVVRVDNSIPRLRVLFGVIIVVFGVGVSGFAIYEESKCQPYTINVVLDDAEGSTVTDFTELSELNQRDVRKAIETGTADISEQQADELLNSYIEYEGSVYRIRAESVRECGNLTSLFVAGGLTVLLVGVVFITKLINPN